MCVCVCFVWITAVMGTKVQTGHVMDCLLFSQVRQELSSSCCSCISEWSRGGGGLDLEAQLFTKRAGKTRTLLDHCEEVASVLDAWGGVRSAFPRRLIGFKVSPLRFLLRSPHVNCSTCPTGSFYNCLLPCYHPFFLSVYLFLLLGSSQERKYSVFLWKHPSRWSVCFGGRKKKKTFSVHLYGLYVNGIALET